MKKRMEFGTSASVRKSRVDSKRSSWTGSMINNRSYRGPI